MQPVWDIDEASEKLEEVNMMDNEQSIFMEIDAFSQKWNQGDAKAAASFYTEDGVRVGAFGDIQHGRDEIAAAFDRLFHQSMPGAVVKQDRGSVRLLYPDLAIWQGGMEIILPGNGPSLKGYVIQVMKKVDGRWLVLETHPKFFPVAPKA
jgi:uncharacterized protein (TIGR02246 family)